jgi:hypothetical protein
MKSVLSVMARRSARLTQWLILPVVLAFLTACQGATTHQAVARKPAADPDWWLGPLSEAHDHLIEAAVKACPTQGFLSNEKCVKGKIVESFSPQNSAGAHCPMDEIGLLLCVDAFTATERIYRTLGQDPDSVIDWDDPYDSLSDLEDQLTAQVTAKCPGSGQDECVAREMATMLPISVDDARRCVVTPDVDRSIHCATGVIRVEGYKNALRDLR